MFGTAGWFSYARCSRCGCLWLSDPPSDLSVHYPADYGGFLRPYMPPRDLKRPLKMARSRLVLRFGAEPLRRLRLRVPDWARWFGDSDLTIESSICDIGAGAGAILVDLWREGFSKCSGFDAFVGSEISYGGRVTVTRADVKDVRGPFDLVMLHHVFEHLPDPLDALRHVVDHVVAPGGYLLIRVPAADSFASAMYGTHWWQLDAPRHLVIPTKLSMFLIGAGLGLEVDRIYCDSDARGMQCSVEYIAAEREPSDEERNHPDPDRLNQLALGDQMVVLYRKPGTPQG